MTDQYSVWRKRLLVAIVVTILIACGLLSGCGGRLSVNVVRSAGGFSIHVLDNRSGRHTVVIEVRDYRGRVVAQTVTVNYGQHSGGVFVKSVPKGVYWYLAYDLEGSGGNIDLQNGRLVGKGRLTVP